MTFERISLRNYLLSVSKFTKNTVVTLISVLQIYFHLPCGFFSIRSEACPNEFRSVRPICPSNQGSKPMLQRSVCLSVGESLRCAIDLFKVPTGGPTITQWWIQNPANLLLKYWFSVMTFNKANFQYVRKDKTKHGFDSFSWGLPPRIIKFPVGNNLWQNVKR